MAKLSQVRSYDHGVELVKRSIEPWCWEAVSNSVCQWVCWYNNLSRAQDYLVSSCLPIYLTDNECMLVAVYALLCCKEQSSRAEES